MVLRIAGMTAPVTAFFLGACTPEASAPAPSAVPGPEPPAARAEVTHGDPVVIEASESERAEEPPAALAPLPDPIPVEVADRRRRERTRALFGEVMEPLSEAAAAYDEHDELEESAWFGRDQEDNLERIDDLLDEAIAVLRVSEIETTRSELRRLENEIDERILDAERGVAR